MAYIEAGWSILEKETFAVLETLDRKRWLATTPNAFDLYTDHNDLIFLFDPLSVVPVLSLMSLCKVFPWTVLLSM